MFFKNKIKISISLQISIFLVLVAFIPVVVMMALNTYEKQQLTMLENSNVQQGRIVSAALCNEYIEEKQVINLLENMKGRFDSRIRILDADGKIIGDSAVIFNDTVYIQPDSGNSYPAAEKTSVSAEKSFVYRFLSFPIRVYRKLFRPPVQSLYDNADFYNGKTVLDGEEIKAALSGKYGAKTRVSSGNQVSVTLYSAIPVFNEKSEKVIGAVLVSRSTYKILQNLYELRRDLAKIFLRSLFVVIFIAVFLAFRISFPLKKLSKQAGQCADKKGRIFFTEFTGIKRNDEIGELSRSFSQLIQRLNTRIQFSQAFSADISHEFKNPLAAIRTSAEILADKNIDDNDRAELSAAVISEVDHLQTLLNGVRKISRIDSGDDFNSVQSVPLPVNVYIKSIFTSLKTKYPSVTFNLSTDDENLSLNIPEDYLLRICENLIDNAAGFGTEVKVTTRVEEIENLKQFFLIVEDNGKGINENSADKIFQRFYSERPENQKENHTGLGLSIVKAIVDSLEGQISVEKSDTLGGACFKIKINTFSQ